MASGSDGVSVNDGFISRADLQVLNHKPAAATLIPALKTWQLINNTSSTVAVIKVSSSNNNTSSMPAAFPANKTTPTRIGELIANEKRKKRDKLEVSFDLLFHLHNSS
jgi:hypothetical protein